MPTNLPAFSLDLTPAADQATNGLDATLRREWFLTNGLGGFASGTALAIPQRRYHAWLIGALKPPVGRVVGLNSMVEAVILKPGGNVPGGEQRLEFSSFEFPGNAEPSRAGDQAGPSQVISPSGHSYLQRFEKDVACRWIYRCGPVDFTRELILVHHKNVAIVRYKVTSARHAARLELRPLAALRDFHELVRQTDRKNDYSALCGGGTCDVSTPAGRLSLSTNSGSFVQDRQWWFNFRYPRDQERGQDGVEDLFSPGWFSIDIAPGKEQQVEIVASLMAPGDRPSRASTAGLTFEGALKAERARLADLLHAVAAPIAALEKNPIPEAGAIVSALVQSSDQFIVRRVKSIVPGARAMAGVAPVGAAENAASPDADCSVIAGYPWFSDWGRDTMISLPGLFLTTGRFDEARRVLETFANLTRRGLVPNCFDNGSGDAEYNTVDASLWFLHAARSLQVAMLNAGKPDPASENSPIRRACVAILEAYQNGTDFNIRMDPKDGLITAGDIGTQLTWMDAKRDGVVFTPRHGKPVEINALWYSGLSVIADMLDTDRPRSSRELRQFAERAGKSFREQFWNASKQCLHDVLTPTAGGFAPNSQIRPNQIFACSLPYSPLDQSQKEAVLRVVTEKLLTPQGLRTLSPDDSHYVPRFEGPLFQRDGAYHNGTVWPWLIGPYAEAVLRVGNFSDSAKSAALSSLKPLLEMVAPSNGGGPSYGEIPEIYDGEASSTRPRRPDGCFAQAWSVAETLRTLFLTISNR